MTIAFRYILHLLLFPLGLLCLAVSAQIPKRNFTQISYKEGLVQSPISSFLQDEKGFVWFGNLKGLTRFDGYEFKVFAFSDQDSTTLSSNRVNTILQDRDRNIWVGTANGVNLYNPDTEKFTRIDVRNIKGGRNYISSLVEDADRNIWVGTFGGVKKLNRRTLKLEDGFMGPQADALREGVVFSLYVDQAQHIWAGTKTGLHKFDPRQGEPLPLPTVFNSIPAFADANVLVTRQDQAGEYWFGTETSGVFRYTAPTDTFVRYTAADPNPTSLPSNWVKDILVFDEHALWFATQSGVSIYDKRQGNFTNFAHDPLDPSSLNDNAIWSFMKDRASCVWVGTLAGGINFYYAGNSNFLNIGESAGNRFGLDHRYVTALSQDTDGSLWVGTYGGGLNHLDLARQTSTFYSSALLAPGKAIRGVKSLADDGQGNLWVGSLNGLSLFNKQTKTFRHFDIAVKGGKLSQNLINAILIDGAGAWVGTNGGGLKYVLPNGEFTTLQRDDGPHALSDNFVTALLKDRRGNLWVGTQDGLNYYDQRRNSFTRQLRKADGVPHTLNNNNITSLYLDTRNRLWIGTEGGGLNYYDESTGQVYVLNKKLGFHDNVIHAIVEDANGCLWLSTDFGLAKLKINRFTLPFKKEHLEITRYTANDGLASNQFSSKSGLQLQSGELAFGGVNGLSVFSPARLVRNAVAPNVVLTELLIRNKEVPINGPESPLARSISQTAAITLAHDQGYVTLWFAALNYINPANNQYAYKLEGLPDGDTWHDLGNQRTVNFANLLPGNYSFKVKAANNDNVWAEEERSIQITVLPPWWKTWWAYLGYTLVLATVLYVIFTFLRNRALLKRELYLEHLHSEKQKELYQLKLDFFTHVSHEIRTPLTLILGPLENLLAHDRPHQARHHLGLIKNNADRLMKLVTELLDFRKAEEGHLKMHCVQEDLVAFLLEIFETFEALAAEKDITYELVAPQRPLPLYFDRNQLEKAIFNLLSNAFKFTPAGGTVRLVVQPRAAEAGWVDICVTDTGKGIPADMQPKLFESFFQVDDRSRGTIGSGIGLALSKNIVELHHGEIAVESLPATAGKPALTTFTISLQTGHAHLTETEKAGAPALLDAPETTPARVPDRIRAVEIPAAELSEVPAENLNEVASHKPTVLVVEDNEEVRTLVAETLQADYRILPFANGKEALAFMEHEIPDLVVSDVMMPEMDGLELCTRLKSAESTNHIPVVLLTARASLAHQIDGLTTGADAYIPKPFSFKVLMLQIKNLLQAQEVLRQKFSRQLLAPPVLATGPQPSPEDKFIAKLREIIETNLGNSDFGVDELVTEIGMSRTVLYKKVQALTNFSVADLIKHLRLQKAAALFAGTTLTVSDVAYEVGFSDRKHFSKEFRKLYHMPPSEFIRKAREDHAPVPAASVLE